MDSEDAACIARIAAGDQTALADLYARYRPALHRFLWQQVGGDGPLLEEVLQDTFVTIWRAAANFRGEALVATWIFRIVRNTASQTRRSPAWGRAAATSSLSDLAEDDLAATVGHEERTLTRLALRDALGRLSEKQRVVVLLVFVHGFTSEEVAEILGVPLGTVKSRLHSARALLVNDPALRHSEKEVNS